MIPCNFVRKHGPQSGWKRNWPSILLSISLVVFCSIAFLKYFAIGWMIDQQIAQKIRLEGETFEQWRNVEVPIVIKFRIFNVTNPVAVQNGGKPMLVEAGPYVYQEKRVKEIIAIDEERDTITYKQKIFYIFRPDLSSGSENDHLVVINVPFVLTYDKFGNFSFAHALANRNMREKGERLFTYATVKEYLFKGYSVQHYVNFLRSPVLTLVGGVNVPKSIVTGKFGFYLGKNGTDDGEFVIRRGRVNSQEFGQIVSWNGKTKLEYYSGFCRLINGSDGSLVPPFLTKESKIRFFSTDICRSMYMIFHGESDVKGVKTYRFKTPNPKSTYDKGYCFCPTKKNNECYKYGVLSMADCRDDAPISASSVHFLDAYEPYLDAIDGLRPVPELHETFMDIEPKTGLILRAAKRIQLNIMVHRNIHMIPTFDRLRPTLFPFLWVEETVESTDTFLSDLYLQLFYPIEIASITSSLGMIACGVFIFISFLGFIPSFCLNSTDTRHNSIADLEESRVNSRASSRSRTISDIACGDGASSKSIITKDISDCSAFPPKTSTEMTEK